MPNETATVDPLDPAETMALLREQAMLYERMASVVERQRALITDGGTGRLMALLGERQKVSAALARTSERLAPARKDWTRHRTRLTPVQQTEADGLLAEMQTRLESLMARDERDALLLGARKNAAASALRSTHTAGEAIAAYRAPSGSAPMVNRLNETSS